MSEQNLPHIHIHFDDEVPDDFDLDSYHSDKAIYHLHFNDAGDDYLHRARLRRVLFHTLKREGETAIAAREDRLLKLSGG